MSTIFKYEKAFSLHDETGECPSIIIGIEVKYEFPFFVCLFQ